MFYDIIIIGAGTSAGFLLSFLSENERFRRLKILVLDKNKEPFRKIYASGNGRCNFSNTFIVDSEYYSISGSPRWQKTAFESVKKLNLQQFFFDKGIPSYSDEYARLLPYTNSAKTIGDFFNRCLNSEQVDFRKYSQVFEVKKNCGAYTVYWKHKKDDYSAECSSAVYSCGGRAYPQAGTDGSSFNILESLGHTITKIAAGIVPLEIKETDFGSLSGLKVDCGITAQGRFRKGEMLFTKYGISGPNVLYSSNAISLGLLNGPIKIILDFLPESDFTIDYFKRLYERNEKSIIGVFGGALDAKFLEVFMKHAGLQNRINADEIDKVYNRLKNVELTVLRTRPFEEAQVSLGGVSADELDPECFESKINKNLFILGEAVDYTGGCGGYNIHWCAAASKGAAGRIAAGEA